MIGLAGALALAARERVRVRFADLGAWGARAMLLAEYDAAERTIGIDRQAVRRLAALGGDLAARFVTCAILHEVHHHRDPSASEAAARAFAFQHCGDDPSMFESLLRVRESA